MLPLSAREVDQQPQSGCPKDQLFPITVCVRCCLVTTLLQSAVHGPGGVSMVWLTSPAGADQLQLLGMHLHGKIKKSGSPGHAATPRRPKGTHALGAMASTRPPQLKGELSSKEGGDVMCRKYCSRREQ